MSLIFLKYNIFLHGYGKEIVNIYIEIQVRVSLWQIFVNIIFQYIKNHMT